MYVTAMNAGPTYSSKRNKITITTLFSKRKENIYIVPKNIGTHDN